MEANQVGGDFKVPLELLDQAAQVTHLVLVWPSFVAVTYKANANGVVVVPIAVEP